VNSKLHTKASEAAAFEETVKVLKADPSNKAKAECMKQIEEVEKRLEVKNAEMKQLEGQQKDTVIAHVDAQKTAKEECETKEVDAREEGRKAGLQACPGVNGLMREIWRLRQKLGAADAGGERESFLRDMGK